ncbi:XRE family transcriptional regulator [Azorhizophilus paspali]|uniref:XRE family transcriptional regulator n=2 Tax=Azorhizophilus paspali TaxID=69963 RepID=A0ABV6SGM1_AZOPA
MEFKDRLKTARKHAKLTQAQLAGRVGVNQTSVSDLERGKSQSTSYIAQIAQACGVSAIWLASGKGEMISGKPGNDLEFEPGPAITSPWRTIPIIGTAQMGAEGYWHALESADGYVEMPTRDKHAYALRLKGNSMAPAIKSGWVAVIEPNGLLIPGEYVMVRLVNEECMLKELLYANDVEVSLASVNDAYERRTIPVEQIELIHAVGAVCPPSKVRG